MDYKEKLEEAKRLYELANDDQKDVLESLFPELKESEDEMIRKGIIHNLKYLANKAQGFVKDELEERIAWLEKQVPVDEEKVLIGVRKDIALSIMNFFDKNTLGMGLSNMEFEDLEEAVVDSDWLKVYRYMKKKIEKQSESKPQGKTALEAIKEEKVDNAIKVETKDYNSIDPHFGKPIDKIEPKFHEGDWVVSPNGVYWHIDKISNNRYEVTANTGESSNWNLDTNIYHKFTIQDAKDGDVLAFDNDIIVIFKDLNDTHTFHSYCFIQDRVFDTNEGGVTALWEAEHFYPATKEQRDIFFAKMKEAGYEWDAEKKELKLIITNGGDFFETENCEQKTTAWSEGDNAYKLFALSAVEYYYDEENPLRKGIINWLNSLKQRINND